MKTRIGSLCGLAALLLSSTANAEAPAEAARVEQNPAPTGLAAQYSNPRAESGMTEALTWTDLLTAPVLVQSGGVSLGSYGAGYAYYYTLARHFHFESAKDAVAAERPFRIVTGASAGSINAVLAALASCKQKQTTPSGSIFYRAWIPVGMGPEKSGLANPEQATSRSLFSRQPIDGAAELVREYYDQDDWLDGECNTLIGLVSTRKAARSLPLQTDRVGSPRVTRQTDKFLLRLKKPERPGEYHVAPIVTPATDRVPEGIRDLYPLLGAGRPEQPIEFDNVIELLKASSAFPIAFAPHDLEISTYSWQAGSYTREPGTCTVRVAGGSRRCRGPEYFDGALYENVPLNLAHRMEEWWRDDPKAKRLTTVVLDYDSESYRRAEPPFSETSRNLLPTLFELGGTLFSANFGAEYFRGLEDYSEDRSVETSRVEFTKRELPPASNHFLNFLGFFERDFRIFDFYLGMLDARRALALDVLAHDEIAESDEEWKVLRCFAAWERESERFQHEPGAGSLPECDALGVGEWRYPAALASAPKQRTEAFAPRYKPSDRAAASRAKPTSSASAPEVGFQGALYEQLSGPKRCQYNLLRLLAASQRYRTLLATRAPSGLTGDTVAWFEVMDSYGVRYPELDVRGAEQAKRAIRDVLYRQLRAMAAMQSSLLDRAVTRLSVSTLANQIEFREPLGLVSIGTNLLRGVELGVGGRLDRGFLRGELQFVAHSIYLRKEYGQRASLGLRGRLVLTLGKFTGPWVQVEPFLGAHAHWGVSSQRDWFGLDGELGSYVVLLQRIYLSLAYTYRHAFGGYPPAPWPRTIDSHSAAAEVGFRFLW